MIEGRLILPVLIAEQADQIRLLRALLAVGQLEQVAQRYGRSEEIAVEIDEREQRTDLARIAEPRIRIPGELLDRIVLTLREHACTLVGTRVILGIFIIFSFICSVYSVSNFSFLSSSSLIF